MKNGGGLKTGMKSGELLNTGIKAKKQ